MHIMLDLPFAKFIITINLYEVEEIVKLITLYHFSHIRINNISINTLNSHDKITLRQYP